MYVYTCMVIVILKQLVQSKSWKPELVNIFDSTFRVDVMTSLQEAQEMFELQMGLQ